MISMLIYDYDINEINTLQEMCKNTVAYISDEKLNIVKNNLLDVADPELAVVNLCDENGIKNAKNIRKRFPNTEIMLIADSEISPMEYLNPDIRPSSLIIRPYKHNELYGVIRDFMQQIITENENGIWIDTSEGKSKVLFSNILYVEARDKRLFIRQNAIEYSIYDSLENFIKKLPANFIRCHRSFAINSQHISRIRFSENYILLSEDVTVPLSRTYKQNIRELVRA